MKTTQFLGYECVEFKNQALSMLITKSVGPRVISLRFRDGGNLFVELPDLVDEFHFMACTGKHGAYLLP
jgi:hypothetical protein